MKQKPVVLVVEDEQVNRKILKKILQESYTILEAENGAQGWKIITERREELAAVLLDIVMPVMDGYEVLTHIRAARMEDLPVIVTTASADENSEQRVLEAGAWDFVTKPYHPQVLSSRLRGAISRSQVAGYERVRHMAEHDELTGLYNRSKMFADTRRMLDEHQNLRFAFIRVDLDHFALFNTSFGESEGDKLLKFLAGCVQAAAKQYPLSTFGRMNADVFCACVPYDGNAAALAEQAGRIQAMLTEYCRDYRLGISAGVCIVEDRSLGVDDFYFRASVAAQNCKNQYATHLSFYDDAIGQKIAAEIAIANEMQNALDQGQFVLYLQPKFDLSTERVYGAEALVRWIHPQRGLIPPDRFIPVFESNGFISKLDYFMWEETCRLLHRWAEEGRPLFPVSVNISRISLYNPRLTELIEGLTKKYNVPPALLQLEVTESAYMTSPELMESIIASLHEAGFPILMDDFGSGYSSLNTLKRFRVDVLKVDMKFLPVGDETERGEIILACVIKMANWLGMSVIVEGVETRRQRDFLEGAGCDYAQGFYYSRPIPVADYERRYQTDDTAAPRVQTEQQPETATPLHNMTILVIDDSEADRVMLQENFRELYHVQLCESAEEGLAYLKRSANKVRLILVDNRMPGMSGLEFLRYCRQSNTLDAIPKIMMTADNSLADQAAAFREGAYDYLTKPLVREIVTARVEHIMEISRRTTVFDTMERGYRQKTELDPLTGLLNKMAFQEIGVRVLETLPDDREALLAVHVDSLKDINSQYGQLAGDAVMRRVAQELSGTFRKTDVLCRSGGNEFAVLMTKLPNTEIARKKTEQLMKTVALNCWLHLHLSVCVSIGLTFSRRDDTLEAMTARAKQALQQARSRGSGQMVAYGEAASAALDERPVVLLCGADARLLSSLTLLCAEAAFVGTSDPEEIPALLAQYNDRVCGACLDLQTPAAAADFRRAILAAWGSALPVLALCQEGDMSGIQEALALHAQDILLLPLQPEAAQRRLSALLTEVKSPGTVLVPVGRR